MYVHFTDEEGAVGIANSKILYASSILEGVFAVSVDGMYVSGVQQTKLGRAKNRDWAVVFTTSDVPNSVFPEECVWNRSYVVIDEVMVVSAGEAISILNPYNPEEE